MRKLELLHTDTINNSEQTSATQFNYYKSKLYANANIVREGILHTCT